MTAIQIKKYKAVLAIELIVVALFFASPDLSIRAWGNSFRFSLSVIGILPPLLVLVGLIEAWVPPAAVELHLGKKSGARGLFLAILLGSVAAGPLFAAFPIASSFSRKGGRVAAAVAFLGAWGTIKIPMLMMESQFLGWKFSLLRLVITVPLIILIGVLVERFAPTKLAL